jgi:hypothetical protein
MRSSESFHPEWGYLAPAPNVMRTARMVAVATAIGATAGAAVVLSLVEGPAASPAADTGKTLVVVHSLVQPAQAAGPSPTASVTAPVVTTPIVVPPAASAALPQQPISVQAGAQSSDLMSATVPAPAAAAVEDPVASDSAATATSEAPAITSSLVEAAPATETQSVPTGDQPVIASDEVDPQKKLTKKRRTAEYDSTHGEPAGYARKKAGSRGGLGQLLRHFFSSARTGNSYFSN